MNQCFIKKRTTRKIFKERDAGMMSVQLGCVSVL